REGDIRDLSWVTTGDIVKFTAAEFTDNEPLKPDEKKILTAVIAIPTDQPPGKMVGTILIGTSCKTYPIPVELDIVRPDFS
ncbi:MAG TPA: hypothetical protein VI874_04325, partial [Candidatus Norongarragalinales archaeon]|nr:hypothetical protein [Candidatus Norongarragalinales archaeon]